MPRYEYEPGAVVASEILLKIRIIGARKVGEEFRIIEPLIKGYHLYSFLDEADEVVRLGKT